jgi:DNA-binding MarR family transcriptional regulator
MNEDALEAKAGQLLEVSEQVRRIAERLAQLSTHFGAMPRRDYQCSNLNEPEVPLERVSWLIRTRRSRARYLPLELFAEPAWDILLDLLRAELGHERMSVSSLCIAVDISPNSGLRWLEALEEKGMVLRQRDARDTRRIFVVLSPSTSNALRRYFVEVVGTSRADGQ